MIYPTPLIFAKKISKLYKKSIWLKLETVNPTGSHKDRESIEIIKDAKKKKFKTVGCASTGNLAVSLAFFARKENLKCEIWINNKIGKNVKRLLKIFNAKIHIERKDLNSLYQISDKIMYKKRIYNANPLKCRLKFDANKKIAEEVLKQNSKIDTIISPVNNGSHIIGISNIKKKCNIFGSYTFSKYASSINGFYRREGDLQIKKKIKNHKNLIEVFSPDLKKSTNLLYDEGVIPEPASSSTISLLEKIKLKKNFNNICCIITATGLKNINNLFFLKKSKKK